MKVLSLALFLFLVFNLHADEKGWQRAGSAEEISKSIPQKPRPQTVPDKLTRLIGITVQNSTGEPVGIVKDLMLNLRDERITYVVLKTGGFLGIGDRLIALPPNVLSGKPSQKVLILNADKESLKNAPAIDRNSWPEMADTQWLSGTYGQYANRNGAQVKEAAGAEKKSKHDKSGEAAPLRQVRATQLIGMVVRNPSGEKLGEILDSGVDLNTGTIRYLVMRPEEISETDKKLFAIASPHFQRSSEPKTILLNTNRETLAFARGFSPKNWPISAESTFLKQPVIDDPSGSQLPTARTNDGRTAIDQSNSRRDLMITQQLRRAIMRDDTMSLLTRNITIITADGRITVRGVVASQEEVDKIVAFAREIAGNEVTNELAVREPPRKETNSTEAPSPKK